MKIIKTTFMVRGCPIWIELDDRLDEDFTMEVAKEILKEMFAKMGEVRQG